MPSILLRWSVAQIALAENGGGASTLVYLGLALGLIVVIASVLATHHPVREPRRALIFRLATLHRVAGPGYVFVLPVLEHIEDELHMGEREMRVSLPAAASGRPATATQLDITWRIHPDVRGRPTAHVRDLLLEPDERRAKLVQEVVIRVAAWALNEYRDDDLSHPAAIESIMRLTATSANAELAPRGLFVDRIFWRA